MPDHTPPTSAGRTVRASAARAVDLRGFVRRSSARLVPVRDRSGSAGDAHSWIAGTPSRVINFTGAGASLMRQMLDVVGSTGAEHREAQPTASPAATLALLRRLLRADVCEPVVDHLLEPGADETVSVVIPFYDVTDQGLFETLSALADTPQVVEVIVVDDASPDPSLAARAEQAARVDAAGRGGSDCSVVRLGRNCGPAAARNAGAARATGKWLAFVDSGVVPDEGWLNALLSVAELDGSALVAPRIRGPKPSAAAGGSAVSRVLDRYERLRSPLDLGSRPSPVHAGAVVSFVPSACVLVGRDPFDALGGFDESLRYGEDVDLVWRMDEANWSVRYVPEASATHPARTALRPWLLQRFRYGRSIGPLADRHPERVRPWAGSISTVLFAAAMSIAPSARRTSAALGLGGLASLGWSSARFASALGAATHRGGPQVRPAAELIVGSQPASLIGVLRASRRPYLPVLVAGMAISSWLPGRRSGVRAVRSAANAWFVAGVALTGTELARDARSDRPDASRSERYVDVAVATAVCLADDLAYSTGVWAAAIEGRRWRAVVPRITEFVRSRLG